VQGIEVLSPQERLRHTSMPGYYVLVWYKINTLKSTFPSSREKKVDVIWHIERLLFLSFLHLRFFQPASEAPSFAPFPSSRILFLSLASAASWATASFCQSSSSSSSSGPSSSSPSSPSSFGHSLLPSSTRAFLVTTTSSNGLSSPRFLRFTDHPPLVRVRHVPLRRRHP
jgi:hypothetical protein